MTAQPLYPKQHFLGSGSGYEDIENVPLTDEYRSLIPKSTRGILVGSIEELPRGSLRCFIRDTTIVVGLYNQQGEGIGYELLFQPKETDQLKRGAKIPEWVFDMQNLNVFGTDWDFQATTMSLWTIAGLRKNGQAERTINLDEPSKKAGSRS